MSLLWTAVVLFVGMIFGIWLTKIMLPTGKLLIDRTKEDKNVMTFRLGSLDPDELAKHKVMLIQIKEVTQK
ncbi:MAG: hypothetical protein ACLU0S_00595 [Blautia obeum]